MKGFLVAAVFAVAAVAATPVVAQNVLFSRPSDPTAGMGRIVSEELIEVNGACMVRVKDAYGVVRTFRCDEDPDEDAFSDLEWKSFCQKYGHLLNELQYGRYCGLGLARFIRITDDLAFSGIQLNIDPGVTFTAPYIRSYLESDLGSGLETNVLDLDVASSGFKLGLGFDAKLHYQNFQPFDVRYNVEFGSSHGTGSVENVPFANDIGLPNVGNGMDIGDYAGGPHNVDWANLTVDRTFASIDKGLGIPLTGGQFDLGVGDGIGVNWDLDAILGVRAGYQTEMQRFKAQISNGAVSDVEYNTDIMGGFFGAYAGLGLDKTFDLPNTNFDLVEEINFAVGLAHYSFNVHDQLEASGGLNASQSHDGSVSGTIPTFALGKGLGIDTGNFTASVGGAIEYGYNVGVSLDRPISNDLMTSVRYNLEPQIDWSVHLKTNFRF